MNTLETQIYELVKHRQHDKAEGLWLELAEKPGGNLEFYRKLTHLLSKSKNKKRLNDWGSVLMANLAQRGEFALGMKIGWMFAKGIDGPCVFLPQLLTCIRELNSRRENLETFLEVSGIANNENVAAALARLDLLFYNDLGEVFAHESYGIGKIVDCDPQRQQVMIEYENGQLREYSFEGTREYLRKFPAGHFHALRLKNPAKLKKRAFDKPAEFMKIVLKSFNRELKMDDLKSLLTENFFSPAEWRDWWKQAKSGIMHDPYVELSGGARGLFKLRETPREYLDDLGERFAAGETAAQRLELLREAQKHLRPEQLQRFVARVEPLLLADFSRPRETPAARLECAYLWEDLHDGSAAGLEHWDEARELGDPQSVPRIVIAFSALDYQCRALERCALSAPEAWPAVYAETLLKAAPKLAAWIVKQLEDRGQTDLLGHTVERLISRPLDNPETCVWGLKQYFDGKWQRFYHSEIAHVHVADLLLALETLHARIEVAANAAPLRASFHKIKNFLWDKHCAILRRVIEPLPPDDARDLLQKIRRNPALTSDYIAEAAGAIRKVRGDLEHRKDAAHASVVYVTAHTLNSRRAELQRIVSEEIPRNSREIGEAAALGDLRENAEYHAAKEYQKVLHRRKEELTELIARAKTIDLQNVRTDQITIGSRFRALNTATNAEESFMILGFWDAQPDRGVLNYLSPLAQQFLEKRVGDEALIQLPGGGESKYQILEIGRAELALSEQAAVSSEQ